MKKTALILGCTLIGMSLCAATFDEVFKQGINTIRKGKSAEAKPLFEEAFKLAKTPAQKTNAILQISFTMPASQQKEALKMLLDYRKTAGKLPRQSEAFLELRIGVLQAQLKQYADAVKTLTYAVSIIKLSDRDLMLAYDMLSNSQLHCKKYEDALKTTEKWEAIEQITPNDFARLMTRKAGIYAALNQLNSAYKAGTEAANVEGVSGVNKALAWQMLAFIAYSYEKNPQKALEYSEKSKAVKNAKYGFNKNLHAKILKACGK